MMKKMKKIFVSVTNDLLSDNRVDRVCRTFTEDGFEVVLIGQKKNTSGEISNRNYKTFRMKIFFTKNFLFYAEYNFRLFLFLLFQKVDILYANDLDTLLPNFLVSKIKNIPLIYDSHEYFTEVPELKHNSFAKKFWLRLEAFIFPKLKNVITVNQSIANVYEKKYGVNINVIRNVPLLNMEYEKLEIDMSFFGKNKIILYQGALNKDRGLEEMIQAMQYIDGALFMIVGDGDITQSLIKLIKKLELEEKVLLMGRKSIDILKNYTRLATIGISIEKNSNKNYYYALPNKLFDYIHANVPVYVSDLPEMRDLVEKYGIGKISSGHNPNIIAGEITNILSDEKMLLNFKTNEMQAAQILCWEKEREVLREVLRKLSL